jgi:hypothetical protein
MPIAITIMIWLLVAGLALLLLAMATPLRIELMLIKEDAWRFSVALRPFGRFGPRIALPDRKKKTERAPKAAPKKRPGRRSWQQQPQRVARAVVRLAADILRHLRVNAVTLDLKFGLGDPAETGQVYGLLAPLIYSANAIPLVRLSIDPAFDRTILTGRAELDLSLIPVTLLAPSVRFGWSAFGPRQ